MAAIRVERVDKLCVSADAVCELLAPDHRGEIYEVTLDLVGGAVKVILCRHHVRMLHHVMVDV
jgi:hypothetical protein